MKKFLFSFCLIIAFTFYVVLINPNSVSFSTPESRIIGTASLLQSQPGTQAPAPLQTLTPAPSRQYGDDSGEEDDDYIPARRLSGTAGSPAKVQQQTPAPAASPAPSQQQPLGIYKDGQYTGSVADAYYGNVQVKAIIKSGKISDVQFLQYPSDRNTSIVINTQAMPILVQEAVQAQSSNVDIVSGATETSSAFRQSLASALAQAA